MSRTRKSHPQTTAKLLKKRVVPKRSSRSVHAKQVKRKATRTVPVTKKRSLLSLGIQKRIGLFLVIMGIILLTGPKVISYIIPQSTSPEEPIMADSSFVTNNQQIQIPTRILIPAVNIDLPITLAKLTKGYWETSENTASFGEGSSPPGQKNNTVVFAHAREHLFLPLKDVKVKDRVYLFSSTQYFSYEVESLTEVKPSDVYIVKKTEDERLTLFTCSGFLDSKRLVVIAKPIIETHEKALQ